MGVYVVVCFSKWIDTTPMKHRLIYPAVHWICGGESDWSRHIAWSISVSLMYTVLPYLYMRIVLRESLQSMGLNWRGFRDHVWMYVVMFAVMTPIMWTFCANYQPLIDHYPFTSDVRKSLGHWFGWELVYCMQFMALEFFYRGFMIHGTVRCVGIAGSIGGMMVPYMMIHFGKPYMETLGAIFAGLFLGLVSLRTKAIYGGMFMHIYTAMTMDNLAMYKKGYWGELLAGNRM